MQIWFYMMRLHYPYGKLQTLWKILEAKLNAWLVSFDYAQKFPRDIAHKDTKNLSFA
jgi:hypothetical protein